MPRTQTEIKARELNVESLDERYGLTIFRRFWYDNKHKSQKIILNASTMDELLNAREPIEVLWAFYQQTEPILKPEEAKALEARLSEKRGPWTVYPFDAKKSNRFYIHDRLTLGKNRRDSAVEFCLRRVVGREEKGTKQIFSVEWLLDVPCQDRHGHDHAVGHAEETTVDTKAGSFMVKEESCEPPGIDHWSSEVAVKREPGKRRLSNVSCTSDEDMKESKRMILSNSFESSSQPHVMAPTSYANTADTENSTLNPKP